MDLGLNDRVAIVTGASKGIGQQISRSLVAEGCRVLLCARDGAALEAVAVELGGAAVPFVSDVTDAAAAPAMVAEALREFGRLDIVVNNAGGGTPKRLEELTAEDLQDGLELNFLSAARLSLAAAPVMAAAGWGRLVHIASVSGREPDPLFAPYSAAKAALLSFSGSLSRRYARDGVLSSCVVPGITDTEMVRANADASAQATGRDLADVMARTLAHHNPATGRFGTPAEIAAAVVFLASDAASWITGATLAVDGGTLRSS